MSQDGPAGGGPKVSDLLAGGVFITLGLAFAVGASTYQVGSALRMGPGYLPLVLGGILVALGLVIVGQGLLAGRLAGRPATSGPSEADTEDGYAAPDVAGPVPWGRGALLVVAIIFFGLTVRGLGLAPSLFVTTLLSALAGHRTGPVRAVVVAAGLTVMCLVVFVSLLQLRLSLLGTWWG